MKMISERDSFRHSLNFHLSSDVNRDDERRAKYQTGSTFPSLNSTRKISSTQREKRDVQMKSFGEESPQIPKEFDQPLLKLAGIRWMKECFHRSKKIAEIRKRFAVVGNRRDDPPSDRRGALGEFTRQLLSFTNRKRETSQKTSEDLRSRARHLSETNLL